LRERNAATTEKGGKSLKNNERNFSKEFIKKLEAHLSFCFEET
jgi:hypothetical protein